MNCQEIQPLLHAYSDGELDAARSLEIEKHIHTCPECRQAYRNQSVLKNAITSSAPYYKAPASLRHGILTAASLQTAAGEPAKPRARHWQWNNLTAGIAMAACLLFGFFIALEFQQHSTDGGQLIGELTSSHIRSLLADHLIDVVSTDQHTVKPWFDGKLDFAPPVNDLAAQGYPLAGGRLDYINGRTVAVLIYKKQKHFINLYIWPSTGSEETLQFGNDNGYHLVNWTHSGMTFWAVSDVNPKDLANFSDLFLNASASTAR
jgi:anti-sigma factor RsiW